MKVGDTVPVLIAGQTVAAARITHMEEGKATLVVPGTVVVMATRTQIDAPEPVTPNKETIVTGVERTSGDVQETTQSATTGGNNAIQPETTGTDSTGSETPSDGAGAGEAQPEPTGETTEVGQAEQVGAGNE